MKPLYISATLQDCGKTTVIVGLMEALRKSGYDVGYMKPVGQRYVQFEGVNVDEDAVLARHAFHLTDALSLHLFSKHHVQVLGVILNKTWPQKLEKIQRAVATGLAHLGTRLLGVIPFRAQLGYPRMGQIAVELDGKVLCGGQNINNPIEHTVVAAKALSRENVNVLATIVARLADDK